MLGVGGAIQSLQAVVVDGQIHRFYHTLKEAASGFKSHVYKGVIMMLGNNGLT